MEIPANVYEQIANFPSETEQEKTCKEIFVGIQTLLNLYGITLDMEKSSYRVKSRIGVENKIKIRKSSAPIRDKYGFRFITEEADRDRLRRIIQLAYPATPERFADGRPSVREYANPEVREYIKKNFNPNISSQHSALHFNIVFQREGSLLYDIAEVQIMTKKEFEIYNQTRGEYVNGRSIS